MHGRGYNTFKGGTPLFATIYGDNKSKNAYFINCFLNREYIFRPAFTGSHSNYSFSFHLSVSNNS
jgi:hypothetical protein